MGINLKMYKQWFKKLEILRGDEKRKYKQIFETEIKKDLKEYCNFTVTEIDIKIRDWHIIAEGYNKMSRDGKIRLVFYRDTCKIFIGGGEIELKI